MNALSIFQFKDPLRFLLKAFEAAQKQDPKLSVRRWARELGFKSHATLVLILNGERPIRPQHVSRIAKGLQLNSRERDYFLALTSFKNSKKFGERVQLRKKMRLLNPEARPFKEVTLDRYELLSEWVHMTLLAMADLKNFQATPSKLSRRLGGKVGPQGIRFALDRLLSLGLLSKNAQGKIEINHDRTLTKNDIPSEALQKYHSDVLDLAKTAIRKTPVRAREFQSFSITVEEKDIPLAKELIRDFCTNLNKNLLTHSGDEVYQFNVQFFPMTERNGVQS